MSARDQPRSAVGRVLGSVVGRFRSAWQALPAGTRRSWVRGAAISLVALFALMMVFVVLTRWTLEAGYLEWEAAAIRWLDAEGPLSFSTAVWLQTFGTDITLWYLVFGSAGIAAWSGRPLVALTILIAYVGFDPVVRIGWMTWDRARPDLIMDGFAAPDFHSFPSGHTGKTVAVYGVLTYLWIRAAPGAVEKIIALSLFLFIALIVPVGRLTMGVHWPTDVIAGALLGFLWLAMLIVLLRKAERSTS